MTDSVNDHASETPYRKKLIEVALPLNAINKASIRENYIYKGNPSAIHKWWSCKPLATCRAVLFASLVDDPSEHPDEFPTEKAQEHERLRLFQLIEELITWENSNNEGVLSKVQIEIAKSAAGTLPAVLDPFCGSGSISLEAQRLGLETHSSDLNPVAVLISKALIEIPTKFAGWSPVHPKTNQSLMERSWSGAQGLADDIEYYGKWIRDEAERQIGHLYPKVVLSKEYGGGDATVIAWLWVRTVTCPNPSCGAQMPLTSKWWLSKKRGKETWIEPKVDHTVTPPIIHFTVRRNSGQPRVGTVTRQGAICIACEVPVPFDYIRAEAKVKRMHSQLLAIVAATPQGRIYLSPTEEHVFNAEQAKPVNAPETDLPEQALGFRVQLYGMTKHKDLFTPRQLVAMLTLSDLVQEVREKVLVDACNAGLSLDAKSLNNGGISADAYADAISTYLAFACDKYAMYGCALAPWYTQEDRPTTLFGRQAISMVWDFAEINPFTNIGGSVEQSISIVANSVGAISSKTPGLVSQKDASNAILTNPVVISTDPPYYDYIGYADLSDFFYVWLRRSLSKLFPELFSTLLVPKSQELIAAPYRFNGDKDKAQRFFEKRLEEAFVRMRMVQHPHYPLTIYYAFKQAEKDHPNKEDEKDTSIVASTGWETMLQGLIQAGFSVTGTWPMRTERSGRLRDTGSNALASSIVLVCRPRSVDAPVSSRRQFLNELRAELPKALINLQRGSIAPVDLAQASIGPGMAIYSRYSKVIESDGTPLRVRTALQLINRALDEVLAEQEGEYDAETRWAIAWFEEYAYEAGEYGRAETLSKAKNTGLQGLVNSGFLSSRGGKVRLLKRDELAEGWTPKQATHLTVWEVMQHMIHALDKHGEHGAGDILRTVGEKGEIARDLAYRLYTVCERKGWASEALAYNSLVTSWSQISRLARREASDSSLWEATYLG